MLALQGRGFSASTYPCLELVQVCGAQGIGLGDDGDEVDACAQLLHDFDVKGLQGVAGGADEGQASVYAKVDLLLALGLLLLEHVRLVLVIEELDDGLPRVAVVDVVAEARGVDNSKADWGVLVEGDGQSDGALPTLEELLLELGLGDLNLDSLVHLLVVSSLVVGIVLDGGGEEGVDEGSLSETRLASNLQRLD